jgi:hypothetical protein
LFCITTTLAQQRFPEGVANTYMLTDKDGYPGYNYSLHKQCPDGTNYTVLYNNSFVISGNNYYYAFDTLQKLAGTISGLKAISNNEAWVFGKNYAAIFKNKQLDTIIYFDFDIFHLNEDFYADAVLFFSSKSDTLYTHLFNGKSITRLGTTKQKAVMFKNWFVMTETNDTWFSKKIPGGIELSRFNVNSNLFDVVKTIYHPDIEYISYVKDENNCLITSSSDLRKAYWYKNGQLTLLPFFLNTGTENLLRLAGKTQHNLHQVFIALPNQFYISTFNSEGIKKDIAFILADRGTAADPNPGGNFFLQTGNQAYRLSASIKKYPGIYKSAAATNIFSVRQDDAGSIWAGSYQGFLSIIGNDKVQQLPEQRFNYMNGGSFYKGCMYLIGEGSGGLIQFNQQGKATQVIPNTYTGFCTYLSKDKKHFYFGTASAKGLWQTTTASLATLHPQWNVIDSTKGCFINNILTITEDTLGRIWYGSGKQALAMYNPATGKSITWETSKQQSPFGAYSSIVDKHGTVWIGSSIRGLWYYSDYSKTAHPSSFEKVAHPFFNNSKTISALTIYNDWLIIAATDKMLLLNIDSLYYQHKTIVRYLNPQEAAFTAPTEQNTLITSCKDSTVWFSTSDMLYQWNINQWLAAPRFKVTTNVFVIAKEKVIPLKGNEATAFGAGFNSFEIKIQYLSPDNMPRYLSALLLKDGDSTAMPLPAMESNFIFKNLSSGNYTFLLDIFEQDGSITHYQYKLVLQKFLWQQWWFWAAITLLIIGTISYLLYSKQKRELAEQAAKFKEAELLTYKEEKEKQLAQLQLVSLSNQFRPHFILNALNAIGARMDEHPDTETVLARLGESVNIIFNHAKQHSITHAFSDEWKLVLNVIQLQQLMYLKQLTTTLPDEAMLEKIKKTPIPLGLLQVPVENALLHGLGNRVQSPWLLNIAITENNNYFFVSIQDNGIGRTKAATLSNFTQHGTGTKNIRAVLDIINEANVYKFNIDYCDDIFTEEGAAYGTETIITIPKVFKYEP